MWLGETDHPAMTIAIKWDVKQQTNSSCDFGIIKLLDHCIGGNFKINIWAWFDYFICSRREIR